MKPEFRSRDLFLLAADCKCKHLMSGGEQLSLPRASVPTPVPTGPSQQSPQSLTTARAVWWVTSVPPAPRPSPPRVIREPMIALG